jgi:hypothetical protein
MNDRIRRSVYTAFTKMGVELKSYAPPERWEAKLNRKNVSHLLLFQRLLGLVADIDGIAVECGLGQMRTFQILGLLLHEEGRGRALWGFDSFQGLPESTANDAGPLHPGRVPIKGIWKRISSNEARAMIAKLQLDLPVTIVEGFFEQSLPPAQVPPIAFLHLDVMLYQSYLTCLEHLFPKVVDGGVVLFDEYDDVSFEKFHGARQAIDAYFASTRYQLQRDVPTGKWFVIKR